MSDPKTWAVKMKNTCKANQVSSFFFIFKLDKNLTQWVVFGKTDQGKYFLIDKEKRKSFFTIIPTFHYQTEDKSYFE